MGNKDYQSFFRVIERFRVATKCVNALSNLGSDMDMHIFACT